MALLAAIYLSLLSIVHASFPQALCDSPPVTYEVMFRNALVGTMEPFEGKIPRSGLVFSPISIVTHSPRVSFLTVSGFASPQVEQIAETGDNGRFLSFAKSLTSVSSVESASGPTMPGSETTVRVNATCAYPYITGLSMIAPSPDWIVQFSNVPLLDLNGSFIDEDSGTLFAYDAGTDSGDMFTNPFNATFDMPTEPPQTIVPLSMDETDAFDGMAVGSYRIRKL